MAGSTPTSSPLRLALLGIAGCALLTACGGRAGHRHRGSAASPSPHPQAWSECGEDAGEHDVYHVTVDGMDVGREVRTAFVEEGADGLERIVVSHLVKNERMGAVLFPSVLVRTERTRIDTGQLLEAFVVKKDELTANRIFISAEGDGWSRRILSSHPSTTRISETTDRLPLSGTETVGYGLYRRLAELARGERPSPQTFSHFDILHNTPFDVTVSASGPETLFLDGQEVAGRYVQVTKKDPDALVVRAFLDRAGVLWFEEFPQIHETRRRAHGQLSLPSETSELIVGLRSETYLYDPNVATRATYHLTSTPDRLDAVALLDEPLNQTVERESPTKIVLTVHAGAPDQGEPPRPSDLGDSLYIKPRSPEIVQAYRYLRSAGKRGRLSEQRRLNATPVIARVALLEHPGAFWEDPDKVAGLVMRYVSALLPDKRHTFSMADAVTTLAKGGGDCTEHAVLFASLMRAHGIPTRLVTGMYLTQGGLWAYHMWNAYWDGDRWRSIDPSTMAYRTGALHVALGRGASVFQDVRDRLADFMWRTFSGVSFNLVEASNEGELLFLARPADHTGRLGETALFNAVVLSERGDHAGALELLDDNIPESGRSLDVKLMRAELLVKAGRVDDALREIEILRQETSAEENTYLLDKLTLECLLEKRDIENSEKMVDRICERLDNDAERRVLKARVLFAKGDLRDAIELLEKGIEAKGSDPSLLAEFAIMVSRSEAPGDDLLRRATSAAWEAANRSQFADLHALIALARSLARSGSRVHAGWFIDHALILAPNDAGLHALREELGVTRGCPE